VLLAEGPQLPQQQRNGKSFDVSFPI